MSTLRVFASRSDSVGVSTLPVGAVPQPTLANIPPLGKDQADLIKTYADPFLIKQFKSIWGAAQQHEVTYKAAGLLALIESADWMGKVYGLLLLLCRKSAV